MVKFVPNSNCQHQFRWLLIILFSVGISGCSLKQKLFTQIRFYIDSESEIETEDAHSRLVSVVGSVTVQCIESRHATPITRATLFQWICASSRGTGIRIFLSRSDLGAGKWSNLYVIYSSGETIPFRRRQWELFFELEKGLTAAFPEANVHTMGRSIYDLVATKDIRKIHAEYRLPLTDRAKERLAKERK